MLKKINQKLNPISSPPIEYRGFEKLHISQPTVFLSNHVSLEDITLLDEALPTKIHFFVHNSEVSFNKNALKKRMFTSYNELNENVFSEMETILKNNVPIFLFPEESISSNGTIMPIPDDIGSFLRKVKPMVYPININGCAYIKSCEFKNDVIKTTNGIVISLGEAFYPFDIKKTNNTSTTISHRIYKELHNLSFYAIEKQNVNLYNEMVNNVKKLDGDSKLIKDENTSLSYKKFLLAVNVLGTKFDKMFENEDKIGTLLPTSVGYALTLFSLFKAGKTPAMFNFTMGVQDLMDCCETADIKTILTSKEFVKQADLGQTIKTLSEHYQILYLEEIKSQLTSGEKIIGLAETKRYKKSKYDNDEIILFTSGSENKPKGVILTHDNIHANIQQLLSTIHLKPTDKFMNVLPMFHSFGMTVGCILPILYGIETFLFPSPISYKKIPKIVYKEKSTVLFGTSTFYTNYGKFAEKHHFQTLRYVIAGAEKLKEEVRELWSNKSGIRIIEGYGVTETSPVLSLNRPANHEFGSVGQLIPGLDYKIEEVEGITNGGNLLVKGPNVMRGYLIHGKGFVPQESWYKTGDVVEMNETEHIFIKARLKRFAKLGGEMVSLNSVEQTAFECYGHAGFAAVSVPDKRKGEKVILFSTMEDTKDKMLKKYIKELKLSNLLIPYKIEYIDEIPILGTGKTNYVALQTIAEEKFSKK